MAVGLSAIAIDLVLIGHIEGGVQIVPVAILPIGTLAIACWMWAPSRASRRGLQIILLVITAIGVWGVAVHFYESREFRREVDPTLSGLPLVLATLRAHSPPSLAPGNIVLLGLLGLLLTFGSPGFPRGPSIKEQLPS